MKLINFKSKLPTSPFSPNYNYFIIEDTINDKVDIDKILNLMLEREKQLIKNGETSSSEDLHMTIRYKFFNEDLFKEKHIIDLVNTIQNSVNKYCENLNEQVPEKLWIQMWCNILRKGQKIDIHQHDGSEHSFLSGNLCVKSHNTHTHYINPHNYFLTFQPEYSSKNESGLITIFPSLIPHYTDMVEGDNPRITISFDVMTETDRKKKLWESKKNKLFEKNIMELN